MKTCRSALAISSVAFFAVACMTAAELAPQSLVKSIAPGRDAEECVSLIAGERIDYQFQASAALDFNLHTHRGNEVVTPVDIKRTQAHSGTFTSPQREDYCMMWSNRGAVPSYLTGEWRRHRP